MCYLYIHVVMWRCIIFGVFISKYRYPKLITASVLKFICFVTAFWGTHIYVNIVDSVSLLNLLKVHILLCSTRWKSNSMDTVYVIQLHVWFTPQRLVADVDDSVLWILYISASYSRSVLQHNQRDTGKLRQQTHRHFGEPLWELRVLYLEDHSSRILGGRSLAKFSFAIVNVSFILCAVNPYVTCNVCLQVMFMFSS